jgi:hypothetical protein
LTLSMSRRAKTSGVRRRFFYFLRAFGQKNRRVRTGKRERGGDVKVLIKVG